LRGSSDIDMVAYNVVGHLDVLEQVIHLGVGKTGAGR
jgi:hypothetical protein